MADDEFPHLLPVDKWVYNLYLVEFADKAGKVISRYHYLSPSEPSLDPDWTPFPNADSLMRWELIKENVPGRPKVIGHMYGCPLHEDGWKRIEP